MNEKDRLSNVLSVLFFLFLIIQVTFTFFIWRDVRVLKQQSGIALSVPLADKPPLFGGKKNIPSFSFTDTSGIERSIDGWDTHPLLVVFSSHDCSACRKMYADLGDFLENNPDLSVVLLSVDSPQENARFLNDYQLGDFDNLTVGVITEETWTSSGVIATPTLILGKENN
ncbi:MAG: TlpA family protein disulfide reductase, partial [Anaerolineales bacterium]